MVGRLRARSLAIDPRKALAAFPIVLALRVCLRAAPFTAIVVLALAVVSGIVPVALYVAVSLFAGEVAGDPSPATAVRWVPLIVLLFFGIQVGGQLTYQLSAALGRRVDAWVRHGVMLAAVRPATVTHMETPRFRTAAELARNWEASAYPPSDAVYSLVEVVKAAVVAGGSVILLLQLSWWVPAVLATGYVLMTVWGTRLREPADDTGRTAAPLRRALYLRDQAFEPASGREARLFGLSAWFRQQSDREWLTAMADIWRGRSNTRRTATATIVALIGSHVFVFAYIMQAALAGQLGVTEAALYIQGAGGLVNLWLPWHVMSLREATRPFPALQALIDEEARQAALPGTTDERARGTLDPRAPIVAIDVNDVTYRYPGQTEPVFDGLNLRIDARCALAIVGANGAGKTTLVKLLCGLLDPDSGTVCVDGVDIRDARPVWLSRVAVIFQDFVRYPFTARDNVVLGRALEDPALLHRALDRAGAADLVADLPNGLDTVLSRDFEGVDLSGGQWQRLALARALYAVERGATVLVLDEPTAQLDVRAEAALFERFLELTAGLTTILISHRFSSVRRADRIVVLDGGRVVEDGSHEELIAAGGRYAAMFRAQASHFEER